MVCQDFRWTFGTFVRRSLAGVAAKNSVERRTGGEHENGVQVKLLASFDTSFALKLDVAGY